MPASRNFREILDFDPDSPGFHCVGVTKKGERCKMRREFFRRESLSHASYLLAEMDNQPLKASYRYLEELASNTLCPRWHTKPGYSQVGSVAQIWARTIQQLEREEAQMTKTFIARQTATRKTVVTEKANTSVKETTKEVPAISRSPQGTGSSITVKPADLIDPFVTRSSAVHASVPETQFTQRLKESRATTSEASSHNISLHSSISNKSEVDATNNSPTTPSRIANLPSPPDTPLVQRQRVSQDTEENASRLPILIAECEGNTPEPDNLSRPFKFNHAFDNTHPQRPPTQVDFQFQPTTVPKYWPETPEATPPSQLQRREAFNFALPPTPSTMSDVVSKGPVLEPKKMSIDHGDNVVEEATPAAQDGDPVETGNDDMTSAADPATPGNEATSTVMVLAPAGDEVPQTPAQAPGDENFGYAVITSSTRSTAYLAATQRNGLMTPPDDPNTAGAAAAKPNVRVAGNDQAVTPLPALPQEKTFKIPRKPVSPSARYPSYTFPGPKGFAGRGQDHLGTEVPVHVRSMSIIDSSPTATSDGHNVHVGCFGGDLIHRLKDKVTHKVREIKNRRMWAGVKLPVTNE